MNWEQTIALSALQRVLHCLLKQTLRLPRRTPAWLSAEKLGYPDIRYCVLSENILLTIHKADIFDACHPQKNTFPASLQAIGYAMPHRPILDGLCPLTSFFRAGNNDLWHAALRLTHKPLPFVCALSLNNAFLKADPKATAFRLSPFALCVSLEQLPDTSEPPGTEHYTLRGLGLPDVPALAAYTSVIEHTHSMTSADVPSIHCGCARSLRTATRRFSGDYPSLTALCRPAPICESAMPSVDMRSSLGRSPSRQKKITYTSVHFL